MSNSNRFYLDGKPIEFKPGDTIMAAAHNAGVYIPHLCFHPDLAAHGSCRLCMVSVNGALVAACAYPAENALNVESNTKTINKNPRSIKSANGRCRRFSLSAGFEKNSSRIAQYGGFKRPKTGPNTKPATDDKSMTLNTNGNRSSAMI